MDRIEIPLSKKKIILLVIGALAFVIIGVFFIINPEVFVKHLNIVSITRVRTVGIASVLFFGVIAIYASWKIRDKRAGLIIDENGIFDNSNSVSIGLIKWADITEIRTEEVSSSKFLLIYVSNPEVYLNKATGFRKKVMRLNYKMYGTPLSITSNTLKYNFSTLEQLLNDGLIAKQVGEINQ